MSGVETNLIDYVNECIDTISTNAGEITKLWEEVGKKQNKLIAGKGILIVGDVISTVEDGMKPGDGLRLDEDILNVDFSRVQSKIKCGSFSAFENEKGQAEGDFFIVEDDDTQRTDPIPQVRTLEAKPISVPVVTSPPIVINETAEEESPHYSQSLTLGASSTEASEEKTKKNESHSLILSGNSQKAKEEDTENHESKTTSLTLGGSSAGTDKKTNTGCLVLG